jgi:hypothetical protein
LNLTRTWDVGTDTYTDTDVGMAMDMNTEIGHTFTEKKLYTSQRLSTSFPRVFFTGVTTFLLEFCIAFFLEFRDILRNFAQSVLIMFCSSENFL